MDKKILEDQYGICNPIDVIYNPSYEEIFYEETKKNLWGYEKSIVTRSGAVSVDTGIYTGRSPKDKFIVNDDITKNTLWWTTAEYPNDNKPIKKETADILYDRVTSDLSSKRLFVVDAFCGASPESRLKVRFITEVAWQAHFVKNMFICPTKDELTSFGNPDFTVINSSKTLCKDWKQMGLNSETFIVFDFSRKTQIIGGTWYGGEMKKGIFAVMNFLLPQKSIATMHCSANQDKISKDVAIFFGLSGTGKTTLSTDAKRELIGDDEHGWDDNGIFNFEGGCYAKTINLNKISEPEIYKAIKRNALLENVIVNKQTGVIDFDDNSKTDNTRVSYPIEHIENIVTPISKGGHAKQVIFLTADAFGVMPPVTKLDREQTLYHFLSGFTAKVSGTERGIDGPTPTFSACFGEAFLTLHPLIYGKELLKKIDAHNTKVYLVNTGWNGTGERISIQATRQIIDSILSGEIEKVDSHTLPIFNFQIPKFIKGVPDHILDPRNSYEYEKLWIQKATNLATLFVKHFKHYNNHPKYKELQLAGPQLSCIK